MKWLLLLFIIVVITVIAVYGYTLSKLSLGSIRVTGAGISGGGITTYGVLDINNDGITPVAAERITYDIVTEKDGTIIGNGVIEGAAVPAGTVASLPLVTHIPVGVLPEETVVIRGKILLFSLAGFELTIPFEERRQMAELLP